MAKSIDAGERLANELYEPVPARGKPFTPGGWIVSHPPLAGPAAAIAAALTALGVCPDDRILIMLPDGPSFAEALFGVTQRGAVALPVNPRLAVADVAAIAAETGAQLVLASTKPTSRLAILGAAPPVLVDRLGELWATTLRSPRESDGDPRFK